MTANTPRIGILGPPSSGKLALAEALQEKQDGVHVIRSAPDEAIYGLPLGEKGSWRASAALYGALLSERERRPSEAWAYAEIGTCFDRLAHCGQRLKAISANLLDPLFTNTEREELIHLQQVMPCLAISLVETWDYNYAFYLPAGDDATEFEREIDDALNELMESYLAAGSPLNILKLEGGSPSERADTVLKVMEEFEPLRVEQLKEIDAAEDLLRARIGGEHGLDTDGPDEEATEGTDRQPEG